MAKTSTIQKELKKHKTVEKYKELKDKLKKSINNALLSDEERNEARKKFHTLPRNASKTRITNRCKLTGRPHGYFRKFGLSRNKLREMAMNGFIPGLVKSSW